MGIVEQYLLQLKSEKRRWRRAAAILTVLSLLVATGVSWNLRMTGVTIANGATCGQVEHQHTEECPMLKTLICGYDGEIAAEAPTDAPTEEPADAPTEEPVDTPTEEPTDAPTEEPADAPTEEPVYAPTEEPVDVPTEEPADAPTEEPVDVPTEEPADAPTEEPADAPTEEPPVEPETETQEESMLDVVMDLASDMFSGFVLTAHAGELSTEYQAEEAVAGHVHTDECYEITWLCEIEEHIHVLSCYSDTTADVESAVIWEATLPERTESWADDLVLIAQSQLGCGESEHNYIVADDGETRNGITRYGQWYGNPYGDWSGIFAMFCLSYADVPQDVVPRSPGVYNMMRLAQDAEIFLQPDDELGDSGNLLFLDTDENGNADRIVVVCAYNDEEITVIGGDLENTVAEIALSDGDPSIVGYINIGQLQAAWEEQEETVPSEPTEPDAAEPMDGVDEAIPDETLQGSGEMSDEPAISLDVEFPEEEILRLVAQISNIDEDMYLWQWQVSEDGNEPWTDIDGAIELICDLEGTEENFNRYYRLRGQKAPVMRVFALSAAETDQDSSDLSEEDDIIISEPIAPFSIGKDWNNTYTIDVFALPVDSDGNRIAGMNITTLSDITVNSTTKIPVADRFTGIQGVYHSAYFGTATNIQVDDIDSVWRTSSGGWWSTYYLAYSQTNGTSNNQWISSANNNISLYLRYIPQFTVTFASEDFESLSEKVLYNGFPTMEEPAWSREGYTLIGWTVNGDEQHVYTFEEIQKMLVTADVTYTAKWANQVTISFNLGDYANELNSIDPMVIPYGSTISPLPIPTWKNNAVAMAFDGWYLNEDLSQQVTDDYEFFEDTILYAKWSPKEDGYFVYFMDFEREGQVPLVLVTYSVTEGHTVSPYTPGNAPAGTEWDGKWYLEDGSEYDFSLPVSDMEDYLTGANGRDLYLYPGTMGVCRAIFVTYGTRVDPITVPVGGTIDLDRYEPERDGFSFAGWTLQDGTPVSGEQTLYETTTFVAKWNADYVPFEAIRRIENANDTGMTQADILGTWYAKAGSQIRVKSTYSGEGDNRKGTHEVVCVLDGVEYPVYTNAGLTQKATLDDVYQTYFLYNNTGTNWTDEVNWDDVYTGGEVPYSTRPVSSAGDTIINFDYMRVRTDIVFTIPNNSSAGGYIDVYKLQQNGLITGSVIYDGTKPTTTGKNVSATGVSAENIRWSYTAAAQNASNGNNYYTLHDMKYGQRIYEVYPVGGSWLTPRNTNAPYHEYEVEGGALFSSRRQDLTKDFFKNSGRAVTARSLTAEFSSHQYIALMYAVECLEGETADFTLNGVGYKVDTELCEVVKHTGFFAIKSLDGCKEGVNALGTYNSNNKYYTANYTNSLRNEAVNVETATFGGTSVKTLFGETYWPYYSKFTGVNDLKTFSKMYIYYYDRLRMNIQFNFGYDSNGDGVNETTIYEGIAHGERIDEYQSGAPDYAEHELLNRPGYEFAGWMDANGFVLEAEDWKSLVATGDSENNTMIFIAKWEKISNNIVEYYEDRSSPEPFESHYFEDGELVPYPTMTVYPEGWVWQEYGEGQYQRFDWDVPMYGEYGVQETRVIDGEERVVNVIRIYGTWDESHTKVVYDPNAPQGGIPGTAPTDPNEYTIWQSAVPVASRGETANSDPNMVFVGWQLDRNGVVYQPGDHVPVQWPRIMTFKAQWAKPEDVVYLRYDPNGGTPEDIYPNDSGFAYKKNATAAVWDNKGSDAADWFTRPGYVFTGWNTEQDGSGTAYAPDSHIVLTAPVTTLYAQWERNTYNLSLYKEDSGNGSRLSGAMFGLYKQANDLYVSVQSLTTGVDGHITFQNLETDTLYKLVEEKPPNGYAVIAKEIFFALRANENMVFLRFYDSTGKEIDAPNGVSGEYITGSGLLTLTVKNLRGYELPSTGSTGIFFHILCGLPLVSAPLVYGLSLRRKYERRSRE